MSGGPGRFWCSNCGGTNHATSYCRAPTFGTNDDYGYSEPPYYSDYQEDFNFGVHGGSQNQLNNFGWSDGPQNHWESHGPWGVEDDFHYQDSRDFGSFEHQYQQYNPPYSQFQEDNAFYGGYEQNDYFGARMDDFEGDYTPNDLPPPPPTMGDLEMKQLREITEQLQKLQTQELALQQKIEDIQVSQGKLGSDLLHLMKESKIPSRHAEFNVGGVVDSGGVVRDEGPEVLVEDVLENDSDFSFEEEGVGPEIIPPHTLNLGEASQLEVEDEAKQMETGIEAAKSEERSMPPPEVKMIPPPGSHLECLNVGNVSPTTMQKDPVFAKDFYISGPCSDKSGRDVDIYLQDAICVSYNAPPVLEKQRLNPFRKRGGKSISPGKIHSHRNPMLECGVPPGVT